MLKLFKIFFSALFSLLSSLCFAQTNLVPNFSFENYTVCPTGANQASLAIGWSKFSNISSTPDYYNSCSSYSTVGVPQSAAVYQSDHRNCGAYMGLVTKTTNPNEREHIGIQLSQPLLVGQKYFLSFYTVMSGYYYAGDYMDTPANNIGLRLSTLSYNPSSPAPIDNFSDIRSVSVITDTINWTRISGSIIANAAYNYLILGNFYDDANTATITQTCATCQNYFSYYLIDDVCISTDSTLCNGGIDVLPCTVSIRENNLNNNFQIYPNPAVDNIHISHSEHNLPYNIIIYNLIGQTLYSKQQVYSNKFQIDISNCNGGLLFVKIESNNQQFVYKLLKQ